MRKGCNEQMDTGDEDDIVFCGEIDECENIMRCKKCQAQLSILDEVEKIIVNFRKKLENGFEEDILKELDRIARQTVLGEQEVGKK